MGTDTTMDPNQTSTNLKDIENAFKSLTIQSDDASQSPAAIAVLADASRWHLQTREQLASPDVLRRLVDIVDCSINDAIESAELALRCIGNACIDNDTARQHVTSLGFFWAKQCLPRGTSSAVLDQQVAMLTAKVLYNICSDFEPAQQQCFEQHVHWQLISLCISDEVVRSDDKSLYIELLFFICNHVQPDHDDHRLPGEILATLLALPARYQPSLEPDDFAMLIEICLLFLREPSAKGNIVSSKLIGRILEILGLNEELLAGLPEDHDDRRLLPPLSTALIWVLSDIAASAEFASAYTLDDEWIRGAVVPAVSGVDEHGMCTRSARLTDAACQILGNLLWSSQNDSDAFSPSSHIQALASPLVLLINDKNDAELLHSAAGVLVQLVRQSPHARETMGADARIKPVVQLLCGSTLPQLKQDGIALLKALGKDSPENQERFADLARDALQSTSNADSTMIEA